MLIVALCAAAGAACGCCGRRGARRDRGRLLNLLLQMVLQLDDRKRTICGAKCNQLFVQWAECHARYAALRLRYHLQILDAGWTRYAGDIADVGMVIRCPVGSREQVQATAGRAKRNIIGRRIKASVSKYIKRQFFVIIITM